MINSLGASDRLRPSVPVRAEGKLGMEKGHLHDFSRIAMKIWEGCLLRQQEE